MEKSELFPVDQEDIDAFWRDGAVVLRGVLNEHWRRELADGITLNLAQPTSRRVDWVRDETTGDHLFHDQLTVAHNPHYERCMLASPLGPLAAPSPWGFLADTKRPGASNANTVDRAPRRATRNPHAA